MWVAWLWLQLWWWRQMDLPGGKDQRRSSEGNAISRGIKTYNLQQFSTNLRDNYLHQITFELAFYLIASYRPPVTLQLWLTSRAQDIFFFRWSSNISILQWKWLHTCTPYLMADSTVSQFSIRLQHVIHFQTCSLWNHTEVRHPFVSLNQATEEKVVPRCYFFSASQLFCISVLIYIFKSACEAKWLFFPSAALNQSRDSHSCQKAALITNAGLLGAPTASLHWTHLYKHPFKHFRGYFPASWCLGLDTPAYTNSW